MPDHVLPLRTSEEGKDAGEDNGIGRLDATAATIIGVTVAALSL